MLQNILFSVGLKRELHFFQYDFHLYTNKQNILISLVFFLFILFFFLILLVHPSIYCRAAAVF